MRLVVWVNLKKDYIDKFIDEMKLLIVKKWNFIFIFFMKYVYWVVDILFCFKVIVKLNSKIIRMFNKELENNVYLFFFWNWLNGIKIFFFRKMCFYILFILNLNCSIKYLLVLRCILKEVVIFIFKLIKFCYFLGRKFN